MSSVSNVIRAILFDLDGTLYVNRELGWEIHLSACRYIAEVSGVVLAQAETLVKETKDRLSAELGYRVSLTRTCTELGADIKELHRHFCEDITPEEYLGRDERVVNLLQQLRTRHELYLYTNNNLSLSDRIMRRIGVEGLFRRVYTIEDSWRPKPDREVLEEMLREISCAAHECLFVGDRYDVDLMLPREIGAQVFLSTTVEELLELEPMTWRCP
jgi:putative hydrolase of the HAD superfamily